MDLNTNKNTIQNIFLFALFLTMFLILVMIFKPFFTVILWSALLYIIISPLHKKIISKINKTKKFYNFKRFSLAGLFSVGTILLIASLIFLIGSQLIGQLISFLSDAEVFLRNNQTLFQETDFAGWLKQLLDDHGIASEWIATFDLRTEILAFIQKYSSFIFSWSKTFIGSTGNFLMSLVFSVFILYFFYLDGSYLASIFVKAIPIKPVYVKKLLTKFTEVTRGLFSGYILVALYQGLAAFILMKIFGVKAALLFSVILMFASFIPLFGAAIIWAPIGIIMCITGPIWKGILFLIIAAITISLLDNFLRPFFLKDRIKVHPLIIFFAILGGVQLFGINGLLLGPIIIILFFTILDILSQNDTETTLSK